MFNPFARPAAHLAKGIRLFIEDLCSPQISPETYFTKPGMAERLVAKGYDPEIAAQIVAITPLVIMGIEVREIWLFGKDDILKRREKGWDNAVHSAAKSECEGISEMTPNIRFLLPAGHGYHIRSVDIWIGGSRGIEARRDAPP